MRSLFAVFICASLSAFSAGLDIGTGGVWEGIVTLALSVAQLIGAARLLWLRRRLWILEGYARGEQATLAHIASGGVKAIRVRLAADADLEKVLGRLEEKLNEKAPE
jgi:hypothetical protein